MNEIKTKPVFEAGRAASAEAPAKAGPALQLGRAENGAVKGRPTQPVAAPATRRDLVELNKKIVAMFRTLNEGLSDQASQKAAADRRALAERMDEMTDALNGMEGMLRIEIAPQFRMMLNEAFSEYLPQRRRRHSVVMGVLLCGAGVVIGVVFSDQIAAAVGHVVDWVATWI